MAPPTAKYLTRFFSFALSIKIYLQGHNQISILPFARWSRPAPMLGPFIVGASIDQTSNSGQSFFNRWAASHCQNWINGRIQPLDRFEWALWHLNINMLSSQFYDSGQLSSLLGPRQFGFHSLTPSIFERTLLTSLLHMMLGLPSDIFPLQNHRFAVNLQLAQLEHVSHSLLMKQLQHLTDLANRLAFLRKSVHQLSNLPHRLLQAFAMGLLRVQQETEHKVSQRLKVLHQEEGRIRRTEAELMASKQRPTSILGMSACFAEERVTLICVEEIVSLLPRAESMSNQDLHRSSIFLLNYYFKQCEVEYLTGHGFPLHVPFKECLRVYLHICKAWLSFEQNELESYHRVGFFIDLTKALSLDGQRFFNVDKLIDREKILLLLKTNYRRMIELGKTVQFIKFYLAEQDLHFFHWFFDVETEFQDIEGFLTGSKSTATFSTRPLPKQLTSISSRCSRAKPQLKRRFMVPESQDPYSTELSSSFIHLRENPFRQPSQPEVVQPEVVRPEVVQPEVVQPEEERQGQGQALVPAGTASSSSLSRPRSCLSVDRNTILVGLLNKTMDQLAVKCKIVMQRYKIKQSIFETMRAIKQFVLLGQGDFVQQFLQLSEPVLSKPSEKISGTIILNLVEEACKSSACYKLYLAIRDQLSFVFLRNEHGSLKGWRCFSLTFRSKAPVNFIFHAESMHSYECIGNLLFNLRRCEFILVSFWRKSLLAANASLQHIRTAVQRFISSLQTYLFGEIDDTWNQLLTLFRGCDSVLQLLEANHSFLAKLKELTIENKPLSNSMLSLVKIVEKFEQLNHSLEEGEVDTLNADVEQIWSWFMSLLDQARHIDHLAESLNFDFDFRPVDFNRQ